MCSASLCDVTSVAGAGDDTSFREPTPWPLPTHSTHLESADSGTSRAQLLIHGQPRASLQRSREEPELPKFNEAPKHLQLLAISNTPEAKADDIFGAALLKQKPLFEIMFTTECLVPSLAHGTHWTVNNCVREDWMENE